MSEVKKLNLESFGEQAVTCDVETGVCEPVAATDASRNASDRDQTQTSFPLVDPTRTSKDSGRNDKK